MLGYFPTNNEFTAKDVVNRIKNYHSLLGAKNVSIAGICMDAFPTQLCAMKYLSNFGNIYEELGFSFAFNPSTCFCLSQDIFHLLNRKKTRLLNAKCDLWIGKKLATVNHIRMILENPNYSKLDHGLIFSDVNSHDPTRDKMNTHATLRLIDGKIENLLLSIEGSEATSVYLRLMRCIYEAFVKEDTSDFERLYKSTFAVHFVRIWKKNIENEGLSEENFVTKSIWECIELNHAFLFGMISRGKGKHIPRVNSQWCENLFRSLRSCTASSLTEINFSIEIFKNKLNQLQSLESIGNDLRKEKVWIPKKFDALEDDCPEFEDECIDKSNVSILPTVESNEAAIKKGIMEAIACAEQLEMQIDDIDLKKYLKLPNVNENLSTEQREYCKKYYQVYDIEFENIPLDNETIEGEHVVFKNVKLLNTPIGKKFFFFNFST